MAKREEAQAKQAREFAVDAARERLADENCAVSPRIALSHTKEARRGCCAP